MRRLDRHRLLRQHSDGASVVASMPGLHRDTDIGGDIDTLTWVRVVKLDERSRRQQVGEGHFPNLAAVPTHAITLTIPALLSARRILCIVPEARKAEAVEHALLGPITEDCPASILRQAGHAHLLLDAEAAAKLK